MYDMIDALPMATQGERTGDSNFYAVEAPPRSTKLWIFLNPDAQKIWNK